MKRIYTPLLILTIFLGCSAKTSEHTLLHFKSGSDFSNIEARVIKELPEKVALEFIAARGYLIYLYDDHNTAADESLEHFNGNSVGTIISHAKSEWSRQTAERIAEFESAIDYARSNSSMDSAQRQSAIEMAQKAISALEQETFVTESHRAIYAQRPR